MAVTACSRALPQPKLRPATEDIEIPEPGREVFTQHFEGVLSQLSGVNIDEIATGDDNVGVDVIAELVNLSFKLLFHGYNSRGSLITPRIADAASVAGLQR